MEIISVLASIATIISTIVGFLGIVVKFRPRIVRVRRDHYQQIVAELDAVRTQNSMLRSRIAIDDEQLALADKMLKHYNPELSLLGPWQERAA